jgi:hypothetical protein
MDYDALFRQAEAQALKETAKGAQNNTPPVVTDNTQSLEKLPDPPAWTTDNGINYEGLIEQAETQAKQEEMTANQSQDDGFWPSVSAGDVVDKTVDFGKSLYKAFTGEDKIVPKTEQMKPWQQLPEFNDFSNILKNLGVGVSTMAASNDEIAQIFKESYPGVTVSQDEKGNHIFKSGLDGEQYAVKPGFRWNDLLRLGGTAAMFAPSSKALGAPTVMKEIAAGMGTAGAIEAAQYGLGGEFNPEDVAFEAAFPLAGKYAKTAVKKLFGKADLPGSQTVGQSEDVIRGVDNMPSSQTGGNFQESVIGMPEGAGVEIPDVPYTAGAFQEGIVKKAEKATKGSDEAVAEFAEAVSPDQEMIDSAKRWGIENHLQPDHVSSDFTFKEISQLEKSQKGSVSRTKEVDGLTAIGEKAKLFLEDMKATDDLGALSTDIKDVLINDIETLKGKATKKYNQIASSVPKGERVNIDNVKSYFDEAILEAGSPEELRGMKAKWYGDLVKDKNPTYHTLDGIRRDIGAKMGQRQVFSTDEQRILGELYGRVTRDQEAALGNISKDLIKDWDIAKGFIQKSKGIESDAKSLFGKKMEDSLVNKLIASNKSLSKTDETKLIKMIKAIPKEKRQDFVSSSLLQSFGNATENGVLNYRTFPQWYENMSKSNAGKSAIMSNLPKGSAKKLDDLYKVTDGIRQSVIKYTGTGASLQGHYKNIDSLFGKVISAITDGAKVGSPAAAGFYLGGVPGAIIGGLTGVAMSVRSQGKKSIQDQVFDFTTSPEFKNVLFNMPAPAAKQEGGIKRLLKSKTMKDFVKSTNIKDPEQWIKNAIRQDRTDDQPEEK